jgi:hypothetical protein
MHLSKVNEALNHRITGGSEYQWNCYGYNVRFLDFESEYAHASVLFDTVTQEVYEANITAKNDNDDNLPGPYRWLNPVTKDVYLAECKVRNIDPTNAWDNTHWVDLEVEEDFLIKANAVFNNLPFDKRVTVPLDLDDSTLLQLALEAHKRDITINQMVEIVLKKAIDFHKGVNAK